MAKVFAIFKGMAPSPAAADPVEAFAQAVQFEHAAGWLISAEGSLKTSGQIPIVGGMAPMAVCQSFALELYLKVLNFLVHSKWPKNEHRLKVLFELLTSPAKSCIRKHYNSGVEHDRGFLEAMKAEHGCEFDLESVLDTVNLAFIRWRYKYETSETLVWNGYGIVAATRKAILEIRPDFSSHYTPSRKLMLVPLLESYTT